MPALARIGEDEDQAKHRYGPVIDPGGDDALNKSRELRREVAWIEDRLPNRRGDERLGFAAALFDRFLYLRELGDSPYGRARHFENHGILVSAFFGLDPLNRKSIGIREIHYRRTDGAFLNNGQVWRLLNANDPGRGWSALPHAPGNEFVRQGWIGVPKEGETYIAFLTLKISSRHEWINTLQRLVILPSNQFIKLYPYHSWCGLLDRTANF